MAICIKLHSSRIGTVRFAYSTFCQKVSLGNDIDSVSSDFELRYLLKYNSMNKKVDRKAFTGFP